MCVLTYGVRPVQADYGCQGGHSGILKPLQIAKNKLRPRLGTNEGLRTGWES
jgi:hypothetical protein